jgi:uncharacterized RDD family membrane protein YckC
MRRSALGLNAAIIDVLLIGLIVRCLVGVLGAAAFSGDAILLLFAGQFLYFFILELGAGQTVGKRFMNVRVVALDGPAVTMRMCAIRNVLRFIDVLPLLYASGLVSLVRTGRSRRQRIGDVVARTTVVVSGDGKHYFSLCRFGAHTRSVSRRTEACIPGCDATPPGLIMRRDLRGTRGGGPTARPAAAPRCLRSRYHRLRISTAT